MSGLQPTDEFKAWVLTFVSNEMTQEQRDSILDTKYMEKMNEYDLVAKVTAKLEDGTYALTGSATVDSVINKTDDASIVLYDTYMQTEFELSQANDPDLN